MFPLFISGSRPTSWFMPQCLRSPARSDPELHQDAFTDG